MGKEIIHLVFRCGECGSDMHRTGESDALHDFYQCTAGHIYRKPRRRQNNPRSSRPQPFRRGPDSAA